ncbi:YdcF family protein [Pseudarthrobacter sp. lyk4-40-TYG-27]|uniref:YdcF family protein n=1 Tax=Pseudarthrobacter sp. lyk4-40-TYG-27 TaxID=3040305 RepID=UPI0025553D7A|nr:YdcF family protein [Pseudarthrobacter sp. lyk4-40-TYG-27]
MPFLFVSCILLLAAAVSFATDRRRLRNGVFLVSGAVIGWLGLLLVSGNNSNNSVPVLITVALGLLLILSVPILAVFLVLNGLIMLRREGRRLANLLSLLAGLAVVAVPLVLAALQTAVPALRALTSAAALLTGYVGFVFVSYLVYSLIYSHLPPRRHPEYVVVLGSGLAGSSVPPLLAARLDAAARMYRGKHGGSIRALIPSGGQGADELLAEGTAMARYLQEQGVPANRIIVEDRAATTMENLHFSRALMERPDAPVTVVTSSYHVFRAAMFTRRAGLRAHVTGARTAGYFIPSAFLREFVAILATYRWINLGFCAVLTAIPLAAMALPLLPS